MTCNCHNAAAVRDSHLLSDLENEFDFVVPEPLEAEISTRSTRHLTKRFTDPLWSYARGSDSFVALQPKVDVWWAQTYRSARDRNVKVLAKKAVDYGKELAFGGGIHGVLTKATRVPTKSLGPAQAWVPVYLAALSMRYGMQAVLKSYDRTARLGFQAGVAHALVHELKGCDTKSYPERSPTLPTNSDMQDGWRSGVQQTRKLVRVESEGGGEQILAALGNVRGMSQRDATRAVGTYLIPLLLEKSLWKAAVRQTMGFPHNVPACRR